MAPASGSRLDGVRSASSHGALAAPTTRSRRRRGRRQVADHNERKPVAGAAALVVTWPGARDNRSSPAPARCRRGALGVSRSWPLVQWRRSIVALVLESPRSCSPSAAAVGLVGARRPRTSMPSWTSPPTRPGPGPGGGVARRARWHHRDAVRGGAPEADHADEEAREFTTDR